MQNSNQSLTVTAVVKEQTTSFLSDELQLKALAKALSKLNKETINVLEDLLKSKDERVRMQVAFKLLDLEVDVKKVISQDQMQRLIAEIKLNQASTTKQLTAEQEDKNKNRPIVDFTTIRTIS
jgi:HEAT repeat protein